MGENHLSLSYIQNYFPIAKVTSNGYILSLTFNETLICLHFVSKMEHYS